MCELLGMSFNEAIMPSLSFRGFRHRGKMNKDGWGLAYYPDESVQVFKEPIRADTSHLAEFIKTYPEIKSKIILAHVRLSSGTAKTHKNTHPFHRELNGKDYVFAHNGTLNRYKGFDKGRFTPVGETDSEYAFCHILNLIKKEGIKSWDHESFDWLHDKLKKINEHGNFNCLMSDGEYLFCYYDSRYYKCLVFLKREAPFSNVRLQDEDFEINLAQEKSPSQRGYVIATEPLTEEKWVSFNPSELIVFKSGTMVFSSIGRNTDLFPN